MDARVLKEGHGFIKCLPTFLVEAFIFLTGHAILNYILGLLIYELLKRLALEAVDCRALATKALLLNLGFFEAGRVAILQPGVS